GEPPWIRRSRSQLRRRTRVSPQVAAIEETIMAAWESAPTRMSTPSEGGFVMSRSIPLCSQRPCRRAGRDQGEDRRSPRTHLPGTCQGGASRSADARCFPHGTRPGLCPPRTGQVSPERGATPCVSARRGADERVPLREPARVLPGRAEDGLVVPPPELV